MHSKEILLGFSEEERKKNQTVFVMAAVDFSPAAHSKEAKWMPSEVMPLAQSEDACTPPGAKCTEDTGCHSDTDFFAGTAGDAFSCKDRQPKISTSSFLEDIFAGLSTSGSSLLSDLKSDIFGPSAAETLQGSAPDDLLDFETEERGGGVKSGDGALSDEELTVEEQIKRNRYYNDDSDLE